MKNLIYLTICFFTLGISVTQLEITQNNTKPKDLVKNQFTPYSLSISENIPNTISYYDKEEEDQQEYYIKMNLGHYGPGGDDDTLWEPNLAWTCFGCNGKDLSDALTIKGNTVEKTSVVCYDNENQSTDVTKKNFCSNNNIWRSFTFFQDSGENLGHYGPGGDDKTLWEPSLAWTCVDCDGLDLSDAITINGKAVKKGSGICYDTSAQKTDIITKDFCNVTVNTWRSYSLIFK
ncbi:MAG: Uncharacterised protein [Flavobacterium sp. SCGC AAA160-P02]|nr:MAG: Uncharacterised protein [Flavobacterium sp. SCGC AAA160-P02]